MLNFKRTNAIGIKTKFLCATTYMGARIKASTLDNQPSTQKQNTYTTHYDHEFDNVENHIRAVIGLHNKLCSNIKYNEKCDHVASISYTENGYICVFGSNGNYFRPKKEIDGTIIPIKKQITKLYARS
jgi:hypothetical protein